MPRNAGARAARSEGPARPPVLVTGATGLVGRALVGALAADGRDVLRLVRRQPRSAEERAWDPEGGALDDAALSSADVVVHLAGEPIAGGRWTPARKERIRHSRVEGTRLLARALARRDPPPAALVCASAVGIYGDRGDEVLTEESAPGRGFLAEVGREWEEAAEPARAAGVRVSHLRLGIVLDREGGALARMLPPFRLGLGGPVGSGRQFWSWVSLPDVVGAIRFAMEGALEGPFNVTAPFPVTSADFAAALGRALRRPARLPLPALAARVALGELADALLLASLRVVPRRLQEAGFPFRHPDLDSALAAVLRP